MINDAPVFTQVLFQKLDSKDTGVSFVNTLSDKLEFVNDEDSDNYLYAGGGVGIGDINNDGLMDIYLVGNHVKDKLFINKGNFRFKDITDFAFKSDTEAWHTGVSMVDINHDGFLDIYVSRRSLSTKGAPNLLYINQGNETFIESAADYGLDIASETFQTLFFDQDLDGDLDAYVLNSIIGEEKTLYGDRDSIFEKGLNQSDYFFENIIDIYYNKTKEKLINNEAYGLGISAGDIDNNGTTDLYIANDFNSRDYVYINNVDAFQEEVKLRTNHTSFYSMGSDIADINNDGLLDILVLDMGYNSHIKSKVNMQPMSPNKFWQLVDNGQHFQYMQNTLQLNNGNAYFSEIAQLAGVAKSDWSWAVLFADFNNDSWNDIVITNGIDRAIHNRDVSIKGLDKRSADYLSNFPKDSVMNMLFQNNKDLTFTEVSKKWGFEETVNSSGIAYADLDNDGDLDLVINNTNVESSIYENKNPGANNFLNIELKDFENNTSAIGSRVTLYTTEGMQMKEVYPVRGFQSSVDTRLHFGLANLLEVDKIEIRWPNQQITTLKNIKANQFIRINYNDIEHEDEIKKTPPNTLFSKVEIAIEFKHQESKYDDFKRELLLPHKYSSLGPCMSVADVNNDNLDDIFIGGSKGYVNSLFLQNNKGEFELFKCPDLASDSIYEDVGSLFFDFNSDGYPDLYIASGSNECEAGDSLLQDRLYVNDGNGQFIKTKNVLPKMLSSTKEIQSVDFDNDGDLDLFVGGRISPGLFPKAPESFLLRNEKTHFIDATDDLCPGLKYAGMITSAIFEDINNDQNIDLILLGEWMPFSVFLQADGIFIKQDTPIGSEGMWYSLTPCDIEGDGDIDFIGGNLGKNTKFKASLDKPFQIFADDFDDNGSLDIVLSNYQDTINYPIRGRDCSSEQMPFIKTKFESFVGFAQASMEDIFGDKLKANKPLQARTLLSSVFINDGKGNFNIAPLPNEVQFAPLLNMISDDFNSDSIPDFFGVGNMYQTEIETVRYDAGRGVCLTGVANGNFECLEPIKSGIALHSDTRDVKLIRILNKPHLVILANSKELEFWRYGKE